MGVAICPDQGGDLNPVTTDVANHIGQYTEAGDHLRRFGRQGLGAEGESRQRHPGVAFDESVRQ